jgi:hypothetical protein
VFVVERRRRVGVLFEWEEEGRGVIAKQLNEGERDQRRRSGA